MARHYLLNLSLGLVANCKWNEILSDWRLELIMFTARFPRNYFSFLIKSLYWSIIRKSLEHVILSLYIHRVPECIRIPIINSETLALSCVCPCVDAKNWAELKARASIERFGIIHQYGSESRTVSLINRQLRCETHHYSLESATLPHLVNRTLRVLREVSKFQGRVCF